MHGQVVHARLGRRDQYQPLRSPLAAQSSDPLHVVDALLRLHPFSVLYIADLDAIGGTGDHDAVIAAIHARHPGLRLWIDAGRHASAAGPASARVPVIGSESMTAASPWPTPTDGAPWVLSLDYRDGRLLGPADLLARPERWPEDIIVMSLDHVGSARGPDLQRLRALLRLAPERRWHAAGGVRSAEDLAEIADAGAHGVLLASALHDGRISAADLRAAACRT